jgi:hypothetical protein
MNSVSSSYHIASPVFYTSPFPVRYLRDAPEKTRSRERLEFHIKSGDYFGTLATIMGLIADALTTNNDTARSRSIQMLWEVREDLAYLQGTHRIEKKIVSLSNKKLS